MAPPVDELGYNRVGGLDVLPDFLDVDDCGAVEVAVAGVLRGLPRRGGSAIGVFDVSITAALHLLAATLSTLLPCWMVTTAPALCMTLYGPSYICDSGAFAPPLRTNMYCVPGGSGRAGAD